MDVVKFLSEIGHLFDHTYSEELLDNDIGTSVIVGRVLSVSITQLHSGPLKCVSIQEEPPLHLQDKPKNVVNLSLWKEFANLDIEVGVLVAVNPGKLTQVINGMLAAVVGFSRKGKMWIDSSDTSAEEDPSASGQQDLPGRGCCKGKCFCGIVIWCTTPFVNVKSQTMTLQKASSHSTSLFNLKCKVLKAIRLREKDAVIRVTDGTLYKWPVLFFDGLSFATKSRMDREINFVDVCVSEIGDILGAVKENVALNLYGVEIGKFKSGGAEYHCFRASGDPRRFKILQKTDTVYDKEDRPSNTEARPVRVVREIKEVACQTDSVGAATSSAHSSGAGITRRKGSRSKLPLSAPEPRSTKEQQYTKSGEPADARVNYAGRHCVESSSSSSTSVSQLTEITQTARPAVPEAEGGGGGTVNQQLSQFSEQSLESSIEEVLPRPAAVAAPRCDRDSVEVIAVITRKK